MAETPLIALFKLYIKTCKGAQNPYLYSSDEQGLLDFTAGEDGLRQKLLEGLEDR